MQLQLLINQEIFLKKDSLPCASWPFSRLISSIARIYIYRSYCGANWRSSDAFSASRHIFGHVDQPNIFFKKQKKERNFRASKKIMGNLILQLI